MATDIRGSSPTAAPQEVELKLYVPPSAIEMLRAHPLVTGHASSRVRVMRIHNRYFDTPDGLLATQRMALRLRRIGSRWLQTLKAAPQVSGAMSSRSEWEMKVAGPQLELECFVDTPLMAIAPLDVLTQQLSPVFTTSFRRELRMLVFQDGTTAEWAIDTGTIATGRGKTRRVVPISELEIELKSGEVSTLLRFATRLARELPLIPLAASKSARGYALAQGQEARPEKVKLPLPHAEALAKPYLASMVTACLKTLLTNVHALIAAGTESDAGLPNSEFVHQARVTVRRLRSALRCLRTQIGRRRFIVLNADLREVGQVLGAARDWDVFVEETLKRISAAVAVDEAGHAAMEQLRDDARQARLEANSALWAYLQSPGLAQTALRLERFVLTLTKAKSASLESSLGKITPDLLERQQHLVVERAQGITELNAGQRHKLRIEVKRMRYAMDMFAGLFDAKTVDPYLNALSGLQDELGTLNDAKLAQRLLQTLPTSEGTELVRQRYETWWHDRIRKRRQKIAALAEAFELTPRPWMQKS